MKMVAEEKNILTGLNELIRTEKKVEFLYILQYIICCLPTSAAIRR